MNYDLAKKKAIPLTVITLLVAVLGITALNQAGTLKDDAKASNDQINQTAISQALEKMENEAQGPVTNTKTVSVEKVQVDGNVYYNWTVGWDVSANSRGLKWTTSSNHSELKTQTYLLGLNGDYIYYPPFKTHEKTSRGLEGVEKKLAKSRFLDKIESNIPIGIVKNTTVEKFRKVGYNGNRYYLSKVSFELEPNDFTKWGAEESGGSRTTRFLVTLDGDRIFLLPWSTEVMSYRDNRTAKLEERPENVIVDFDRDSNLIIRFGDRISTGRILEELEPVSN